MELKTPWLQVRKLLSAGVYSRIAEDDLKERQRYKLFFIFSMAGFLICLAESFHAIAFDVAYTKLATGLQLFSITFLLNYLALQRHQKLRLAYFVGIITAFFCIHLFNYYYGGIRNSGNFYYIVIIITTFMLMGSKEGWLMMGLSIVNQVYFYVVSPDPRFVWNILENNSSDLNQDFLFSYGLAILTIGALSRSLGSSKNVVIRKITEARNVLAEKNKELSKLSLVADKTDSAVIITDHDQHITWVNDAFTRMTGYSLDEVTGLLPDKFLYGEQTDFGVVQSINKAYRSNKPFHGEIEQYHKGGSTYWVSVDVTPVLTDTQELSKVIMIQTDITSRKSNEKKIREYLTDLEKTNKELDEFAYVVSHDLKAPLHAISNLTSWIEDDMKGSFSEDTSENFNIIKNRVVRMEDLINGLLQFARANHGEIEREEIDLNKFIPEILEFLDVPENCTLRVPAKMPTINSDRIRLQQVLVNLIGNAIKYNDKDKIYITLSATDCGNKYEFSIKDNGPGIDNRFHEKIFVIFQTLTPRDTMESTGVGLAIVKKIIEEEGGRIWIDSEPGHGAEFKFTWPKEAKKFSYRYKGNITYFD
jgi:PAS domain S-box-containing protein